MVQHSQRMGGHACPLFVCHTYLPISEKDIDRGFTESNKIEKLKEQIWDGKVGGIKMMRTVIEGQTRWKVPSVVFFPWVNLKKPKWTNYDVFDWEDKKGRALFFIELF